MNTLMMSSATNRVAVWAYTLLALSLIPTLMGVAMGPAVPSLIVTLILFAGAIGIMLVAVRVSEYNPLLGAALFFLFAFLEGMAIAPLISKFMATGTGQIAIVKALCSTAVIFVGLSVWTWAKGIDAQGWGSYLFAALLSLIVVSILSLFFPTSIGQTLISLAVVLLFSLFIVYDTSEVIHGRNVNPVRATIQLYLDALNIFVHLLQLFGGSSDD